MKVLILILLSYFSYACASTVQVTHWDGKSPVTGPVYFLPKETLAYFGLKTDEFWPFKVKAVLLENSPASGEGEMDFQWLASLDRNGSAGAKENSITNTGMQQTVSGYVYRVPGWIAVSAKIEDLSDTDEPVVRLSSSGVFAIPQFGRLGTMPIDSK